MGSSAESSSSVSGRSGSSSPATIISPISSVAAATAEVLVETLVLKVVPKVRTMKKRTQMKIRL